MASHEDRGLQALFVSREDGESSDYSDSDLDWEAEDPVLADMSDDESASEEESTSGPTPFEEQMRQLRDSMPSQSLCIAVKGVLMYMDTQGINLPIFLDALSWGDDRCIKDPKIRHARSSLMHSTELQNILSRWHKPPRSKGSRKRRPKGARQTMETFAADCAQDLLGQELDSLCNVLSSPAGEDICEDALTGVVFDEMVHIMQECAPNLWRLMRALAFTSKQEKANTRKDPNKVSQKACIKSI